MYNDPLVAKQWYLLRTGVDRLSDEYTGLNVKVGIFDDGLQVDHPDLAPNYDAGLQAVIGGVSVDPGAGAHGTCVAGIIAAAANDIDGVGIANQARIAGVNIFSGAAADNFTTAIRQMARFDVTNNSWGMTGCYSDNPNDGPGFGTDFQRAIDYAARAGRGGLGTIIVNAAGNEWTLDQRDANTSAFNQARQTITVGAVTDGGQVSSYSVRGASLLVSAPSSGGTSGIATTDMTGAQGYSLDDTTDAFGGTSAATPIVSAVAALMLQANPRLGWRDVQEILAYSADHVGAPVGARATGDAVYGWRFNGADNFNGGGLHFSNDVGFGVIDAFTAVRKAEVWRLFGSASTSKNEVKVTTGGTKTLALKDAGTTAFSFAVTKAIDIEHVDLSLTLTHSDVSELTVELISPDKSRSIVLRAGGESHDASDWTWTLGSEAFRGELSKGVWTVRITDTKAGHTGTLDGFRFDAYGAKTTPHDVYHFTDELRSVILRDSSRKVVTDTDGGRDWLDFAGFSESLSVNLRAGASTYGEDGQRLLVIGRKTLIENVVTGDGNDRLIGNTLDNKLYGMRGNDTLIGGAGRDVLAGGTGTDSADYTGSKAAVTVDLLTGKGTGGDAQGDKLYSVENLFGSRFNDRLFGNDGDNRLDGGAGNDLLVGRGGADVFAFRAGFGTDRVLDFTPGADKIDLTALGVDWSGISATDVAGGCVLAVAGGAIALQGVTAAMLTQDNFLLV